MSRVAPSKLSLHSIPPDIRILEALTRPLPQSNACRRLLGHSRLAWLNCSAEYSNAVDRHPLSKSRFLFGLKSLKHVSSALPNAEKLTTSCCVSLVRAPSEPQRWPLRSHTPHKQRPSLSCWKERSCAFWKVSTRNASPLLSLSHPCKQLGLLVSSSLPAKTYSTLQLELLSMPTALPCALSSVLLCC